MRSSVLHQRSVEEGEQEERERLLACEHLWNSSNRLLANAPTIAGHLGFRLVTERTDNKMKPKARANLHALLCTKCGKPTWTGWTRVRKRARAYKGAKNRVLTRCTDCQAVVARPGARVCRPQARAKALQENSGDGKFSFLSPARSTATPQTRRSFASSIEITPLNAFARSTVPRAVHSALHLATPSRLASRVTSGLPTTVAIRKKSKSRQDRRRSSGGISSSALFQEPAKLATSFLFEDVEE